MEISEKTISDNIITLPQYRFLELNRMAWGEADHNGTIAVQSIAGCRNGIITSFQYHGEEYICLLLGKKKCSHCDKPVSPRIRIINDDIHPHCLDEIRLDHLQADQYADSTKEEKS